MRRATIIASRFHILVSCKEGCELGRHQFLGLESGFTSIEEGVSETSSVRDEIPK